MGQAIAKQLGGQEIFAKEKKGGNPSTEKVERQSLEVIDDVMSMLLKSHMDKLFH